MERKVGLGKVILFNTSASDANWSNLYLNPNFVPLLQQTIFYATSSHHTADKNIFVGDVYSESLRGKRSTEVKIQPLNSNNITPLSSRAGVTVPVSTSDNEDIKFDKTTTAGIYLIEIQTDGKIHRDFFAVNVDTRESDLNVLSEEEALRKLGHKASFIKKSDQFAKTIDSYRTGKEIFGELLILAVLLMLAEVVLANYERKSG